MKIIALADIHMACSRVAEIDGLSEADLIIALGDITNFGGRMEAKTVLNEILSYNKNLLCLAGNLDNDEINTYLDDLNMNLHGQAHLVKRRLCIYGVGGSNPTPFQTPWEFSEGQLMQIAEEAYRQAQELIELARPISKEPIPSLFVSHAPPHGTSVDKLTSGKHVGSKAIRRFIEKTSPDFCLVSHIHESRGADTVGNTPVVNPGMLANNGWVTITVDRKEFEYSLP